MLHTITLCFTKPAIVRKALENYYRTATLPTKHYLLHQHYPLPSKSEVFEELKVIAKDFNCVLSDAGKNLGLHHGFNAVLKQINPKPEDIIIGYDHDSCPVSPGWDEALVKVLNSDPNHVWGSLRTVHTLDEIPEIKLEKFDGIYYFKLPKPAMNSVCAIKASFLEKTGGLHEYSNFYGHLETNMWNLMKEHGGDWFFLLDYFEKSDLLHEHDESYKLYKWAHAQTQTWDGDFESYLEAAKKEKQ